MDPQTPVPLDAAAVLAWMQANPARLRALLAEEDPAARDDSPAADSAVRAHLRFAAEGLMAGIAPALAPAIEGMADGLGAWFAADRDVFDRQILLGRGAIALEEHLLYGADGGSEPAIHAALERRMRIGAWIRLFLRCLESRLGPGYDGLTEVALDWSGGRGRDLASAIVQGHHRHLTALAEATGHPTTAAERDQSSQAAAVQANVRQTIDAVAHALAII